MGAASATSASKALVDEVQGKNNISLIIARAVKKYHLQKDFQYCSFGTRNKYENIFKKIRKEKWRLEYKTSKLILFEPPKMVFAIGISQFKVIHVVYVDSFLNSIHFHHASSSSTNFYNESLK